MVKGLPIESLDDETRARIGYPPDPGDELIRERVIILGKVLKALQGLRNRDALWVLKEAQQYIFLQHNDGEGEGAKAKEEQPPSLDKIMGIVAETFELDPIFLKGHKRTNKVALARQVAMYILVMTNRFTMEEIGLGLGGRDHSTISYGFQIIVRKLNYDIPLKNKVMEINSQI